jgi:hypothetical protein
MDKIGRTHSGDLSSRFSVITRETEKKKKINKIKVGANWNWNRTGFKSSANFP